jgi:hypothetical protein
MLPIQLSLNQRLGVVAFVLGAGALFASPRPVGTVTLDTRELALIVEGKLDHVSAEELADWIIQGRGDYRLIDVREAVDYAEYHIPTAEPVSLATLPDYPLWRTEKIVLYSDGGQRCQLSTPPRLLATPPRRVAWNPGLAHADRARP